MMLLHRKSVDSMIVQEKKAITTRNIHIQLIEKMLSLYWFGRKPFIGEQETNVIDR